MAEVHPLFETVPPARRYSGGSLGELWLILNKEAKACHATREDVAEDLGWHWRMLPRGAMVALRVRADLWNRRELRIARAEPPADAAGWRSWTTEIAVFLKMFHVRALDGTVPCEEAGRDWYQVRNEEKDRGRAAVRLQELRRGEVKPGRAICHDCLTQSGEINEIEWKAVAGIEGQRCNRHALEAGRRHLQETR